MFGARVGGSGVEVTVGSGVLVEVGVAVGVGVFVGVGVIVLVGSGLNGVFVAAKVVSLGPAVGSNCSVPRTMPRTALAPPG